MNCEHFHLQDPNFAFYVIIYVKYRSWSEPNSKCFVNLYLDFFSITVSSEAYLNLVGSFRGADLM